MIRIIPTLIAGCGSVDNHMGRQVDKNNELKNKQQFIKDVLEALAEGK